MNYYILYLKKLLNDQDDSRAADYTFICSRGEAASEEYERQRRLGLNVVQAQEMAVSLLISGI